MRRADVEAQLVEIGVALSGQADKLGRAVAAAIRAEIDFYRNTTVIGDDELIENCTSNLRSVFRGLQGIQTFDTTPAESTGITRADAGVPLPALMGAYRVGFRISWQAVMQLADANPGFGRTTLLIAAQRMWEAHDVYVDAMSTAFRERQVQQVLEDEAERAALTEHLLEGRITDNQTLWEVAQLLGLPSNGPYVVVAAIAPAIGKHALPGITDQLRGLDIYSAWRLLPDQQIGIVQVGPDGAHASMVDLVHRLSRGRVGISGPFQDLADTTKALRYARIALNGSGDNTNVTVFDDSILGIAAVTEPDVTIRLAGMVLGALHGLSSDDRELLTQTFRAWVDHRGCVADAAAALFCHPNTVRYRLRRLEELTCRSLSVPKDISELCLAFEIEARLASPKV
jgi:hypothetical protein